ncbi:hypothetical protein ACELLULO517_21120 [Acidisoma cellulosilytica]|uniref:DoxX family protein n=1 Tax=Acidisoma cellulosilyticum TaxID=2802395 RepID=A0A963Z4K0_9PROT|nr:hypothetical protein [Acidisoma cellulosilyticum]MCB8882760.1 hypothetical protein [Acidisoma cellulosilyticum]
MKTHATVKDNAMNDNPIHTFLQFLTGGIPDQVHLGDGRWFTVALYWILLLGSFLTVYVNWRRDPSQRSLHHISIYAMRLLAAGMWYLGTLWKLPLPVSAGFKYWLGATVKYSSFPAHAAIMQVFVTHIALVQPVIYLLEIFFTASLMLGFMVRLTGILAALFTLNLLIGLYNDPTEWPWTYVGIICTHGMFAASQAGRSLGIDNLLAKQLIPRFRSTGPLARVLALAS